METTDASRYRAGGGPSRRGGKKNATRGGRGQRKEAKKQKTEGRGLICAIVVWSGWPAARVGRHCRATGGPQAGIPDRRKHVLLYVLDVPCTVSSLAGCTTPRCISRDPEDTKSWAGMRWRCLCTKLRGLLYTAAVRHSVRCLSCPVQRWGGLARTGVDWRTHQTAGAACQSLSCGAAARMISPSFPVRVCLGVACQQHNKQRRGRRYGVDGLPMQRAEAQVASYGVSMYTVDAVVHCGTGESGASGCGAQMTGMSMGDGGTMSVCWARVCH